MARVLLKQSYPGVTLKPTTALERSDGILFWLTRNVIWRFRRPRFIVLLGGPGAGKGTLATQLSESLGLAHLSTGDALRREIANKTELGLSIKAKMEAGELLSDSIILAVLKRELQRWKYRHGAILDGLPRTFVQAQLLDTFLAAWGVGVESAVLLDPGIETLKYRLSNRRTCSNPSCGRTYHLVSKPPQVADVCDACKSPLYQRKDDVPQAIEERLSAFEREFKPIREHYGRGLIVVNPTKETSEQQVFSEVLTALRARRSLL
jgi:adenylate kinase